MSESLVFFKGSSKGVYIHIGEGSFDRIKEQLDLKLKKAGSFFEGGQVVSFKGRCLTSEEKQELKEIVHIKYGLGLEEEAFKSSNEGKTDDGFSFHFQGIEQGPTKFIATTIRSGQITEYQGNIVVLADVNPGGVVTAWGNIIVLGSLRGIAVAGSDGNRDAIIAAFNLQPTQLRIGDIISRSPDNNWINANGPEIARVRHGNIVIEPYLTRK